VKSVSSSEALPVSVPSQLQALADRLPQAQAEPEGLSFSLVARLQVHSPAGRWSVGYIVSVLVLQYVMCGMIGLTA
jgi:hypothetical protein